MSWWIKALRQNVPFETLRDTVILPSHPTFLLLAVFFLSDEHQSQRKVLSLLCIDCFFFLLVQGRLH